MPSHEANFGQTNPEVVAAESSAEKKDMSKFKLGLKFTSTTAMVSVDSEFLSVDVEEQKIAAQLVAQLKRPFRKNFGMTFDLSDDSPLYFVFTKSPGRQISDAEKIEIEQTLSTALEEIKSQVE
ncbi:MAG: hypothetical protein RL094_564 [Candidatus Parcubacteria bacterium]|jgi:hypothetical protein